jgi:hypothetical protein
MVQSCHMVPADGGKDRGWKCGKAVLFHRGVEDFWFSRGLAATMVNAEVCGLTR